MVTLPFLSIVRTCAFRVSLALFALVLFFVLLTLLFNASARVAGRIRSYSRRRIRDTVYRYMLSEIAVDGIVLKGGRRQAALDLFSSIISIISGNKRERMKAAVRKLGLVKEVLNDLFSLLPARRLKACHRLGLFGSSEDAGVLVKLLDSRNSRVAAAAVLALGEIRAEAAIRPLFDFLTRCSLAHAWLAAAVLPFFGREVCGELKHHLMEGGLSVQKRVILLKIIAELKAVECAEELYALYANDPDLDIRINALSAIGKMNDVRAATLVTEALKSAEWPLRAVACRIVGEMALAGAAYRMIPLVKDPSWHVRHNATRALTRLGNKGMDVLLACLDLDDPCGRDMVVNTLEETGIVDQAVREADGSDEGARKRARILVKSLVRRGYTRYLGNFASESPSVKRMLEERAGA